MIESEHISLWIVAEVIDSTHSEILNLLTVSKMVNVKKFSKKLSGKQSMIYTFYITFPSLILFPKLKSPKEVDQVDHLR